MQETAVKVSDGTTPLADDNPASALTAYEPLEMADYHHRGQKGDALGEHAMRHGATALLRKEQEPRLSDRVLSADGRDPRRGEPGVLPDGRPYWHRDGRS